MKSRGIISLILVMIFSFLVVSIEAKIDKKQSKSLLKRAKKLRRKNLPKCLVISAQSVKANEDNKKAVKFLVKYYHKQIKKQVKYIAKLEKSKDLDGLYLYYKDLCEMNKELKSLPPLKTKKDPQLVLATTDHTKSLEIARKNAAEMHYNNGIALVSKSEIVDISKGKTILKKCDKYFDNYRNYKSKTNSILLNCANSNLNLNTRMGRVKAAYIYDQLNDIDGFNVADLRAKGRTYKQNAKRKVYINKCNNLSTLAPNSYYLINLVGDRGFASNVVDNVKENLSDINNVDVVCILKSFKIFDSKNVTAKTIRKEYFGLYDSDKKDYVVDNTIVERIVINEAKKQKEKKILAKNLSIVKGTVNTRKKTISFKYSGEFELIDLKTKKVLDTREIKGTHSKTYIGHSYGGISQVIPKKIKKKFPKSDINLQGTPDALKKLASQKIYTNYGSHFKSKIIEIFK